MGKNRSTSLRLRALSLAVAASAATLGLARPAAAITLIPDNWLGTGSATDWSNPALWSAGVPNDDAVNKYVVNLQNDQALLNSLATPFTVYSLSNLNTLTILNSSLTVETTLPAGGQINVSGPNGSFTVLSQVGGSTPNIAASAGGLATIGYQTLNINTGSTTFYSADGVNSLIDAHTI